MSAFRRHIGARGLGMVIFFVGSALYGASPDFDETGYVDLDDYFFFEICHSISGPGEDPAFEECHTIFDADVDGDVDLRDFASYQSARGHAPIPLLDRLGNPLTADATEPYSPRQTCGGCHDHEANTVANGEWFQQGRADLAGNVDMRDDYDGDGKYWIKSAGRYGKWGQSFQFMLAAKNNVQASDIDQGAFAWIRDCSSCHAGGGPGEYDRDGMTLYDLATGTYGYELLNETAADVALDGDYAVQLRGANGLASGTVVPAPWEVTGLSEPDCLICHRGNRPTVNGADMVIAWRRSALGAGESLVDASGASVPAFAAASTAGQGWFAPQPTAVTAAAAEPAALSHADQAWVEPLTDRNVLAAADPPVLQIDYGVGLADGSLVADDQSQLYLPPTSVTWPPRDRGCVGCHPLAVVTGTIWYDSRDIHYAKFNNLSDLDNDNDLEPAKSTACTTCHPGAIDHNAAKGNSFQLQYRNELDYAAPFRSCRDCHLSDSPVRHPDAPEVPGEVTVHLVRPFEVLSCQACHIPYALTAGLLFRDITVPGSVGWTTQYLSSDPLDPTAPRPEGDVRWYPSLRKKMDTDGVERWFPASVWINIYWGDWNQMGTPEDLSDDVIAPIYTWRVAQATSSIPPDVLTDDDGDGRMEINRFEEIIPYIEALKGNDANGVPVATRPVLVRGERVFYQDPDNANNVLSFNHVGTGIPIDSSPYIWGMDHNVLAQEEAWGAGDPPDSCNMCHNAAMQGGSPVFDRKILIDPLDENNQPVYRTVRELTGLDPDNPTP